ncbi:MAG: hypothetical protein OEN50_14205 [Deltaproteobacteria bacterium]|nr:hypothetical protein [Deltaproteobacteria bacterium]
MLNHKKACGILTSGVHPILANPRQFLLEPFSISAITTGMKIVRATLWIYGTAWQQSWQCVGKNWVVSFAPLAYGIVMSLAGLLAMQLGFLGGFLLAIASQACVSSGLHLIKNMISSGKANLNDFLNGFIVYLWDLLTVAFILWIPLRFAAVALASVPNGWLIYLLIQVTLYIILNPVPELIYQTRTSGLELLSASYNFIVENWLEWLLPNVIITVAGVFLLRVLDGLVYMLPGFVQFFAVAFGFGLFLTYLMTFRGFLFAELHGTTRRSRLYRYDANR